MTADLDTMEATPGEPSVRPVATEPCWHVRLPDGRCPSWHDDGCPHHPTEEQAHGEVADHDGDPAEHEVHQREQGVCLGLWCHRCGRRFEMDPWNHLHMDADEVSCWAGDSEWAQTEDGQWLCWDCDCIRVNAEADAEDADEETQP